MTKELLNKLSLKPIPTGIILNQIKYIAFMKILIPILFLLLPLSSIAQSPLGVSFHQSNIPFIGINYEIKDHFRPEIRLGVDVRAEDVPVELIVSYDVVNKESHEVYAGLGGRINQFEGIVIPLGANFYPFSEKRFGLHIELAPIFLQENSSVLRGSWGIRYRFR